MTDLPQIVSKTNLRHYWWYKNETGATIALVVRYDDPNQKKKTFRQFRLNENNEWVEGAVTPSPIFGIETLNNRNCDENVHIFEGERCVTAAHQCSLISLTSMMGANSANEADWAVLAKYRHFKQFVLIPDNDNPGKQYMHAVYKEIKRVCPLASIKICFLSCIDQGDDFIDWLLRQDLDLKGWDGFSLMEKGVADKLGKTFQEYVKEHCIDADKYLEESLAVRFASDPEPIIDTLSEVLPCPAETFPLTIQFWLSAIANQMQVPLDFLAVPFLVYSGSVLGRKVGLLMRPNTKWIEFANLWGMIIGRPSVMKSPPMKAVQAPLQMLVKRAKIKYQEQLEKYQKEIKIWKILEKEQLKKYQVTIQQSFQESQPSNLNNIPFPSIGEEPKKPIYKRYKTQDATVEKVGEIIRDNPQGILIYRDEVNGWLNSLMRKGREEDRQFYLEGVSGGEERDVDRIGRGHVDVPQTCFSIFGSIQPGPISKYVYDSIKGGSNDDGFLQRFQAVAWPDIPEDWKLVEIPPLDPLEDRVFEIYDFLDLLQFAHDHKPQVIGFSPEAQKLFDNWQEKWELKTRKGGLPDHLCSHFGKYKKLLAALALVFEHIHAAEKNTYPSEVSKSSLEISIRWIDYFESHAIRFYNCGLNVVPKAAKGLLAKVKEGKLKVPFSARDIYHGNHWSGLANADQVREVIHYLIEKKYLSEEIEMYGRRAITKYLVHPKFDQFL